MRLEGKKILLVGTNQLALLGLRAILRENFSPDEIEACSSLDAVARLSAWDFIFMPPEVYVHCLEKIRTVKAHIVILSDDAPSDGRPAQGAAFDTLSVRLDELELSGRLQAIFRSATGRAASPQSDTLTSRETDVLRLVAMGRSNKQIADALSISMHTVISHRKNITQKLGIRTVSGLTMYALLNGLISMKNPN